MDNLYRSATNVSSRENFYQEMLLKYKREKEKVKEAEEKEIEKEIQKENLRLEIINSCKRKKTLSLKEKINRLDNYLDNKLERPKENLASQIKHTKSYELDGGLSSYVDRGIEDVGENYFRYPGIDDLDDEVDDEEAVRENFDKVKKDTKDKILEARKKAREAKEAQKAAKAAKAAKTTETTAKAAKVGAEAAKVAKVAKASKWIFNIGKIATAAFSLETLGISLLITILFWIIQIVGYHCMGLEFIPKMSTVDWIGFIACAIIIMDVLVLAFLIPFVIVVPGIA